MEASHMLLGRPWQFDKQTFHDGYTNKFSFNFQGRKITLKPLSPQEVSKDQEKMQKKRKEENETKREKKREGVNLQGEGHHDLPQGD